MTNQQLLQNTEQYVRHLFATKVLDVFTYHNIEHTEKVVNAARLIGNYYKLPEEDQVALLLAAWFHDTGFSTGRQENHETESQRIAATYLQLKEANASLIEKVTGCIAATKMPQTPKNLTEQILCDSDLYHLGTEEFVSGSKSVRRELIRSTGIDVSREDWRQNNIQFLEQHHYFTEYARTRLEPVKQQHLKKLLKKEYSNKNNMKEKLLNLKNKQGVENSSAASPVEEKIKKDKDKESRTERGVVTLFRIISNNHVTLSQMADNKANIMISVNTIVLSILVSVMFNKLQFYPQFFIPTIILCIVCLGAIIFSILATRPNVSKGTFSAEDIKQKKINLLFFGNFFKMELPDYEWAMKEMMLDSDYLYGSMIKDIHSLGIVLAKKYKLLRLSYNIFMFGLIIAVIAFLISFWIAAS